MIEPLSGEDGCEWVEAPVVREPRTREYYLSLTVEESIRGKVQVRDGAFVGDSRRGQFLRREPCH